MSTSGRSLLLVQKAGQYRVFVCDLCKNKCTVDGTDNKCTLLLVRARLPVGAMSSVIALVDRFTDQISIHRQYTREQK